VLVPEDMSYETAALMGCRFGTSYRAVCNQANLKAGDFILVFGAGGVGLSAVMIARALGARVAVIDPQEKARALAIACGAEVAFQALNETAAAYIQKWSEFGVHACLDAIGHPQILQLGLNTLRRRGKFVQVGLLPDSEGVPQGSFERVVAHELEILGSHGMAAWQYQEMLQFVARQDLPLDNIFRGTYSLHEAIELLMKAGDYGMSGISVVKFERA
jgi:alcohol dehydrogenase